jgi:DNA polymerase-3 subunit alpha
VVDFCARVGPTHLNRRALESLILAGALDGLGAPRSALFAGAGAALERAQQVLRERESGQGMLFGGGEPDRPGGCEPLHLPPTAAWRAAEMAAREKEVLGFYLSEHPLGALETEMRHLTSGRLGHCLARPDGADVRAAGIVVGVKSVPDRKGNPMAFVQVEDDTSRVECVVFSDLFAKKRPVLVADRVIWVRGRVSCRDAGEPKLVLDEVLAWEEARAKALALHLEVQADLFRGGLAGHLDQVLAAHAGEVPVYLHMLESGGRRTVLRSRKYRVAAEDAVTVDLIALLGPGSARWAPRL